MLHSTNMQETFNFHNKMKARITRSHSHVALCLPRLHKTHQACIRGLLEKYPTFGREKETGLPGALDT